MARTTLRTAERLYKIEERQFERRWGSEYRPSIEATRHEAPKVSRPSKLYSPKLERTVHLMSLPERAACLLALYHPNLFDLHEQHMLFCHATDHPLAGHPYADGQTLTRLKGTVDVAERMNIDGRHPVVRINLIDESGEMVEERESFPYIGDFLLFLQDAEGAYCVNWTVKKDAQSFSRPFDQHTNPSTYANRSKVAEQRHLLEEQYFADANIRTVRVASDDIDRQVVANLTMTAGSLATYANTPHDERHYLIQQYRELLESRTPVLHHLPRLCKITGCEREHCLATLYGAIWHRELRVDLTRPIFPDKPLRGETVDLVASYRDWFRR